MENSAIISKPDMEQDTVLLNKVDDKKEIEDILGRQKYVYGIQKTKVNL